MNDFKLGQQRILDNPYGKFDELIYDCISNIDKLDVNPNNISEINGLIEFICKIKEDSLALDNKCDDLVKQSKKDKMSVTEELASVFSKEEIFNEDLSTASLIMILSKPLKMSLVAQNAVYAKN